MRAGHRQHPPGCKYGHVMGEGESQSSEEHEGATDRSPPFRESVPEVDAAPREGSPGPPPPLK